MPPAALRSTARSPPRKRTARSPPKARPAQSVQPQYSTLKENSLLISARSWAVGPGLIVLSTFLQLAPKFVVSNALLVGGHGAAELTMRKAGAAALMVSLSCEMVWTALHPNALSLQSAGLLLLLAVVGSSFHTAAAFAGPSVYGPQLAFWLQSLPGICTIPANQSTALWRLAQRRSPARWRIVGWIVTLGLGTLTLLVPSIATTMPTIVLSGAFPLALALALATDTSNDTDGKRAGSHKRATAAKGAAVVVVPASTAMHYVCLAVIFGTNAEAINDVAVGLRVRHSLASGSKDLALTNNASVLISQVVALLSETRLAQGSERMRYLLFLSLWSGCQVARALGMRYLDGDAATAQSLLAAMGALTTQLPKPCSCSCCAEPLRCASARVSVGGLVFFDKYTGPLGQAALDTASVALLQAHALPPSTSKASATRPLAVPAALLISLRAASFKFERPLWDLLLLHEESWPLPFVPVALLLVTVVTAGVVRELLLFVK